MGQLHIGDLIKQKLAGVYPLLSFVNELKRQYYIDNIGTPWPTRAQLTALFGQTSSENMPDAEWRYWNGYPYGGTGFYLLENGVDRYLLEDGSGLYILE
jgi:hypothetical protein